MLVSNSNLTRNQALVLDVLLREQGPLSAYNILDRLREKGLRAPLQIYRALDKLTKLGRVHRLESVNAFVACRHFDDESHDSVLVAFAICQKCGTVIEFSDNIITKQVRAQTEKFNFQSSTVTLEISGLCQKCTD